MWKAKSRALWVTLCLLVSQCIIHFSPRNLCLKFGVYFARNTKLSVFFFSELAEAFRGVKSNNKGDRASKTQHRSNIGRYCWFFYSLQAPANFHSTNNLIIEYFLSTFVSLNLIGPPHWKIWPPSICLSVRLSTLSLCCDNSNTFLQRTFKLCTCIWVIHQVRRTPIVFGVIMAKVKVTGNFFVFLS